GVIGRGRAGGRGLGHRILSNAAAKRGPERSPSMHALPDAATCRPNMIRPPREPGIIWILQTISIVIIVDGQGSALRQCCTCERSRIMLNGIRSAGRIALMA